MNNESASETFNPIPPAIALHADTRYPGKTECILGFKPEHIILSPSSFVNEVLDPEPFRSHTLPLPAGFHLPEYPEPEADCHLVLYEPTPDRNRRRFKLTINPQLTNENADVYELLKMNEDQAETDTESFNCTISDERISLGPAGKPVFAIEGDHVFGIYQGKDGTEYPVDFEDSQWLLVGERNCRLVKTDTGWILEYVIGSINYQGEGYRLDPEEDMRSDPRAPFYAVAGLSLDCSMENITHTIHVMMGHLDTLKEKDIMNLANVYVRIMDRNDLNRLPYFGPSGAGSLEE